MHITDYNKLFEMNKELFKTLRDDPYNQYLDSDLEDTKYEMKNNLQFVQEKSINIHSKSDFFKLNSQDSNCNETKNTVLKKLDLKLSDWEKKPAKCKIV